MSTETKRLQTIPEAELRRARGGDEPETSRSRPLTGFFSDATASGMGGQVRPLTGMFGSVVSS